MQDSNPKLTRPLFPEHEQLRVARAHMVNQQIVARSITDSLVIRAMQEIPRHYFVPESDIPSAYEDHPLSIGLNQTISQPFIVAFMTECLRLQGTEKVLEIGTGSGYQTAILSSIVSTVFSIEIHEPLQSQARQTLKRLGINNVFFRQGDGHHGWPEEAPFDSIIVTAAPEDIPQPLLHQLGKGGRLITPLGKDTQRLVLIEHTAQGFTHNELLPVAFVPMTKGKGLFP